MIGHRKYCLSPVTWVPPLPTGTPGSCCHRPVGICQNNYQARENSDSYSQRTPSQRGASLRRPWASCFSFLGQLSPISSKDVTGLFQNEASVAPTWSWTTRFFAPAGENSRVSLGERRVGLLKLRIVKQKKKKRIFLETRTVSKPTMSCHCPLPTASHTGTLRA